MLDLKSIPNMKVYRQRFYIAKNQKDPSVGSVAILNNKSIEASLEMLKRPNLILTNSKYVNFYVDRIYKETIRHKNIVQNRKDYQLASYEKIKAEFPFMKTPINFASIGNRNFFYDLSVYNELFFKYMKSAPIKQRITSYYKFLHKWINNSKLENYDNKTMYINVESWMNDSNDTINNPISYFLITYKKFFDLFKELGDIDIVLFSDSLILKFNPITMTKELYPIFKRELGKVTKDIIITDDDSLETELKKDEIRTIVISDQNKFEFTGSSDIEADDLKDGDQINDEFNISEDEELDSEMNNRISDKIDSVILDPDMNLDDAKTKIKAEVDTDQELVSFMHDTIKKKKTGKSTASLARDEELRKKQKELKLENIRLDDLIQMNSKDFEIPAADVSKKVVTTNENVKKVRFTNFEKSYNDTLMKRDTAKIITNLNNKSIPVFIKKIEVNDSSDELNYKETYHVTLEDGNRVRHNLTFDVPKFIDDKFLYLNGNKKVITKQLFMKPIVKTDSDEVQVCTNYNKVFITRYGPKVSPKVERFKRAITNTVVGVSIKNGDASSINNKHKSILEYDELSKNIISFKTSKFEIVLNQDEVYNRLGTYKLEPDDFCVGFYSDGSPIIMSFKNEKIGDLDLVDFIIQNSPDKFKEVYNNTTSGGNRFIYSRATIMAKHVPLILLLGYCEGITEVLRKGNIKHYFSDKRPTISDDEGIIRFEDGYFVYDRYPIENSLLLNALYSLPTRSFSYTDLDDKDIYLDLFAEIYNSRNLANAFDSFYEFLLDPITVEVLEDLDYPTDFVSVMLFANSLLADNSYIMENNMNLYRIRSNEIVNALIHREIADAYAAYRNTANNKNPVKISIQKDAIIKKLLSVNTVEEFSTLNPIYETEKLHTITPRGVNGMNLDDAYTQDKRSYDKTMMGILGMSTSPKKHWAINIVIYYSIFSNCGKLLRAFNTKLI